MSDYIDTTSDEYFKKSDTETLQVESEDAKADVNVEEKEYGMNKPYRITIKAKISHGKD